MYDETNVPGPEYRVRTVIRYLVTCYYHPYTAKDGGAGSDGCSRTVGEFPGQETAIDVAKAMAASEPGSTLSI